MVRSITFSITLVIFVHGQILRRPIGAHLAQARGRDAGADHGLLDARGFCGLQHVPGALHVDAHEMVLRRLDGQVERSQMDHRIMALEGRLQRRKIQHVALHVWDAGLRRRQIHHRHPVPRRAQFAHHIAAEQAAAARDDHLVERHRRLPPRSQSGSFVPRPCAFARSYRPAAMAKMPTA
ncbi:MAG: hypothetical protein NTY59_14650 [Alphaproteobacteria bacterium]|nr:hypothetical protein [Alphaproteobacteria bacterium]